MLNTCNLIRYKYKLPINNVNFLAINLTVFTFDNCKAVFDKFQMGKGSGIVGGDR
jgi:hypothetical protein